MNLSDFLVESNVSTITSEVIVSARIKDPETGEPYKFKIRGISSDEYSEYQKRSMTIGKKGKVDFDAVKLNELLTLNHTVEPNFRDVELIKRCGCVTPDQFMKKVLLAGEIAFLAEKIAELSGFDRDISDMVDEVKN